MRYAILLALCASTAFGLDICDLSGSVSSGATATVTSTIPVKGKVLAVSVDVGAGSTQQVAIASAAGYGMSVPAAQTILANAAYTADLQTNLASTIYLYGDYVVMTLSGSTSTVPVRATILMDEDP
jgi:hypothetical protein